MIASIALRRSIRNYKHSPVPQDFVEKSSKPVCWPRLPRIVSPAFHRYNRNHERGPRPDLCHE